MIPRWGVLYSITKLISRRYSGRVFVHLKASGHFFNQHYLTPMFPLDVHAASAFLDQTVFVDTDHPSNSEAQVSRKEIEFETKMYLEKNQRSISDVLQNLWFSNWVSNWEFGSGDQSEFDVSTRLPEPGEVAFLGSDAAQAKGKTLREMSRLWKYANGGVPDD